MTFKVFTYQKRKLADSGKTIKVAEPTFAAFTGALQSAGFPYVGHCTEWTRQKSGAYEIGGFDEMAYRTSGHIPMFKLVEVQS